MNPTCLFTGPYANIPKMWCGCPLGIQVQGQFLGLPRSDGNPAFGDIYDYGSDRDRATWPTQADEYLARTVPDGFEGVVQFDMEGFHPLASDPVIGLNRELYLYESVKKRCPGAILTKYSEPEGGPWDATSPCFYPRHVNDPGCGADLISRVQKNPTKPVIPVLTYFYTWTDCGKAYGQPLTDQDVAAMCKAASFVASGTVCYWADCPTFMDGVHARKGLSRVKKVLASLV